MKPWVRVFAGAFGIVLAARSETAILDCTDSAVREGSLWSFAFRMAIVQSWKIDGAKLFLHLQKGPVPKTLRLRAEPAGPEAKDLSKVAWIRTNVQKQPDGWLQIDLPPALAARLAAHPDSRIVLRTPRDVVLDGRTANMRSPYLFVEGRRPPNPGSTGP